MNNSFTESLSGHKTYIVATLMVLYAVTGLALGDLTANQFYMTVLQAAGLAGLRSGINSLKK